MGSKGLKAVIIDKPSSKSIPFADAELFKTATRAFAGKLIDDPKLGTQGAQHLYGTASIVGAVNEMGSMPTRNFSNGSFEQAADLRGEHMREVILAREGKVGTRCMPGCIIACRNQYVDEAGMPVVGTLQYETIALIGSNLGLGNLDDVARLNYMCNDLGLDTIETGAALGLGGGRTEPVIAVTLDGTGFGLDATVWGGEWLIADDGGFHRVACLEPLPLPGGDSPC